MPLGGNVQLTLTLNESSDVAGVLRVTLAPSPTGIANVSTTPSPCVLSTASNTCTVNVSGAATGSTTLTATSTAGPPTPISASAAVTVGAALTPSLVFTPDPLVLMSNSIGGIAVTLSMANPPVNPVQVALTYSPTLAQSVTPDPCVLSAATPTCALAINNTSVSNPTGQYFFTATPLNSSIPAVTLPVYISTLQPVARTLTVTNNCPYTVWAGMSGGAVASVTPIAAASQQACPAGATYANGYCCPTGSSTVAGDYCFWSNPTPTNGYVLPTPTGLKSTQFVIPSNSLTTAPNLTHVWSGGIMARRNCDGSGNCAIGTCNGGATGEPRLRRGRGLRSSTDGGGVHAPPGWARRLRRAAHRRRDGPYLDGADHPDGGLRESLHRRRGRIQRKTQAGSLNTLNPATWSFTPPAIGTPASSTYLTLVSGASGATETCAGDAIRGQHWRLRIRPELDEDRADGHATRADLQPDLRDVPRLSDGGRALGKGNPHRIERGTDCVRLATRHSGDAVRDPPVSQPERIPAVPVRRLPESPPQQRLPAGDHVPHRLWLHQLDRHRDPHLDLPGHRRHGLHRHHPGDWLQLGVDPKRRRLCFSPG